MLGMFKACIGDFFGKARSWQLSDEWNKGFRAGVRHDSDNIHKRGYHEGYNEALDAVRDNRIVWAEKLCSRCHISEQRKKYSSGGTG